MNRARMLRFDSEADLHRQMQARRERFNAGTRGRDTTPERDILASVLAFLKRHPKVGFAVRMNSGVTKYRDENGVERFVRFGFKGCPDIWACLRGGARMMLVEVKSDSGTVTDEQRAVLDTVNAAGGIGIVAHSIDDVARALEAA